MHKASYDVTHICVVVPHHVGIIDTKRSIHNPDTQWRVCHLRGVSS